MAAMPSDDERLASLIAHIGRAGRKEFPSVQLPDAALGAHLAGREVPADLAEERAAEVYLACACARGDAGAIALLRDRYLGRVEGSLRRGRSPALVEEAVLQLLGTIFVARPGQSPEIGDFTGSGPLGAWLRIVALRILMRLERKQRQLPEMARASAGLPTPESPEVAYLRRKYSAALQDALGEAWKTMSPENQVLLRLRYNDGRGVDDIAKVENIHRATAARRVKKAEESLIDEARRILSAKLGASENDVNSVLQLVRSQLQISVGRIFKSARR
jgi:RNA polymerase sigma-70 factor, ECF subfamily